MEGASWEFESSKGLSSESLRLSLSHLASSFQDSLVHSRGVYSILDLVLHSRARDFEMNKAAAWVLTLWGRGQPGNR